MCWLMLTAGAAPLCTRYYKGIYHVWHQCCQNHWDHVISSDLIHWQRVPPPIQPLSLRTFDGSISMLDGVDPAGPVILYDAQDGKYLDRRSTDTDGLGNLSAPLDKPIVGVARLDDPADKYLVKWHRESFNPVSFQGGAGIAFPGPIWKEQDHWNFIGQGSLFQSADATFKTWTRKDIDGKGVVGRGEHSGQWWMPVPNAIDGTPPPAGPGDPNRLVNVGGGGWWGASGGTDNNCRMMMIGWALPDYHGPAGPGVGVVTRLTGLREINYDAKTQSLVANPVPELKGLRSAAPVANETAVALSTDAAHVVPGTADGAAASADIELTFSGFASAGTNPSVFGACVLGSATNSTTGLGITITVHPPAPAGASDGGDGGRSASVMLGTCGSAKAAAAAAAAAAVAAAHDAAPRGNATVSRFMNQTNFPHGDIKGLDHQFPLGTGWQACQQLCDNTSACHAWTFLEREGGMACCIKGPIEGDGCPEARPNMVSGAKVAGTVPCSNPGPGPGPRPPRPPHSGGGPVPLFDDTEVTVRIMPDRSLADFFVQGGRFAGTEAWTTNAPPRDSADSQVSVFASTPGIQADVSVWVMGCGWLTPSYTEHPDL